MSPTPTPTSAPAPAPAPGEISLPTLLPTLRPTLSPETYIYLTTTTPPLAPLAMHPLKPQLLFQEPEGLTIITTRALAEAHGYGPGGSRSETDSSSLAFPCRKIMLGVQSSLEAVGLIAAVAGRLGERGISANVVSGFFHDYVFVPEGREGEAMEALEGLAREAAKEAGWELV
ncbi:hypothetical protein FQN50_008458 [Emmonsiellopsis sp. PD_5]|nr:hypothetical protein FQN50_008458 [Emmonsiellopsis sp. PD_5]